MGKVVFRHGVSSWTDCTMFSETRAQQSQDPMAKRRPTYRTSRLVAGERDVKRSRLYTSSSWWLNTVSFIIVVFCILPIAQTESIATSCPKPTATAAQTKCERDHGCEDKTMGHSESPEKLHLQTLLASTQKLWVFGYGSLVWKTGFDFKSRQIGFITGYVRRFWQGDTSHRGSMSMPGRVATLEKDNSGLTWGVAFELEGREQIDTALEHLGMRECSLGGYDMLLVPFYPQNHDVDMANNNEDQLQQQQPLQTLVFVASPENRNYLGVASVHQLTEQIIGSKGNAGHNVEYVTRLADFMRENIPADELDDHLDELDINIRKRLQEKNIVLNDLLAMSNVNYRYMHQELKRQSQSDGSKQDLPNSDISIDGATMHDSVTAKIDLTNTFPKDILSTNLGSKQLTAEVDSNNNEDLSTDSKEGKSKKRKLIHGESTMDYSNAKLKLNTEL